MSDEQNLTFVGGKAVEQHESMDSNVPDDTREEAVKAVREAIKGAAAEAKEGAEKASKTDPFKPEGAKAEPLERDPDTGKFLKKEAASAEKEEPEEEEALPDIGKASVKQLLKNREKLAKAKHEAKQASSELERERTKLAEETRKVQETWHQIQEMQRQVQAERNRFDMLKKDPARAVREVGWEPEQFVMDLARDGTPEGQMARQQRELAQQLSEIRQWKEDQARQAEENRRQSQVHQADQYRSHIEKQFITLALNEEKHPHLTDFYKGRERMLIAAGDLAAAEFRELSGGREATLDDLVEFLEEDLADRASNWYTKKSGASKDKALVGSKPAKGSKGKTLSPEASSERRSLGRKALKDLDEDERLQAAREAVGLALED